MLGSQFHIFQKELTKIRRVLKSTFICNITYPLIGVNQQLSGTFSGLHFVDELTACKPEKCYHKDHPVNRAQAREYYRSIAKLSKELFGGFQSEGWIDFMNADVDYIMYASFNVSVQQVR